MYVVMTSTDEVSLQFGFSCELQDVDVSKQTTKTSFNLFMTAALEQLKS